MFISKSEISSKVNERKENTSAIQQLSEEEIKKYENSLEKIKLKDDLFPFCSITKTIPSEINEVQNYYFFMN